MDAAKPLRKDAARNRERILAAARELFGERGLDATLDDVAARAGVGVGTVYRRYPNKLALLEEVLADELSRVIGLVEAAAEAPDAWSSLVGLVEEFAGSLVRNAALDDLLFHSSVAREQVEEANVRLRAGMATLVDRAKGEGRLREDFDAGDIPAVLTMATAIGRELSDEVWPRYVALIVDGMRRRRDRPSPLPVAAPSEDELDRARRRRFSR